MGNVIAAALAALLCPVATEHYGISGAAWSYLATMVLLVISFLVPYAHELSRAGEKAKGSQLPKPLARD